MKICKIRFKNLNSLIGEWEIDLTHPDFVSEGIFAITGPTGAGKSTILDAICVALYGRTPRLSMLSANTNDIMSRHAGDCYSEVDFYTSKGMYRCHWGQSRARRKSEGNLQQPKHELCQLVNGEAKIIASKIKEVAKGVIEITGLDYQNFTRSMLLAQGSFAAFLESTPHERSAILEELTGTDIYSTISINTHLMLSQHQAALRELEALTQGIQVLSQNEEDELRVRYVLIEKKLSECSEKAIRSEIELNWRIKILSLEKEIHAIQRAQDSLNISFKSFFEKRQLLEAAQKALTLDGDYARLFATRELLSSHLKKHQELEIACSNLELQVCEETLAFDDVKAKCQKLKQALLNEMPKLQQVREWDQQINQQEAALQNLKKEIKVQQEEEVRYNNLLKKQDIAIQQLQKRLKASKLYFEENANDENLIQKNESIRLLLRQWNELKDAAGSETIEQAKRRVEFAKNKRSVAIVADNEAVSRFNAIRIKEDEARGFLKSLLGDSCLQDWRKLRDAMQTERELRLMIASLEQHRSKLKDGEACPLCGSLEHPYAIGNIPQLDEMDHQIAELSAKIKEVEQAELRYNNVVNELHQATLEKDLKSKELALAVDDLKQQQDQLTQMIHVQKVQLEKLDEKKKELMQVLVLLEVTEELLENSQVIVAQLQQRIDEWRKQQTLVTELQLELNIHIADHSKLLGSIETLKIQIKSLNDRIEIQMDALNLLKWDRRHSYGERIPDQEETALKNEIQVCEDQCVSAESKLVKSKMALAHYMISIKELKQKINDISESKQSMEKAFSNALQQMTFESESAYISACLDHQRRSELELEARQLEEERTRLSALHEDRKLQLNNEYEKAMSDLGLDALQRRHETLQQEYHDTNRSCISIRNQLDQNEIYKNRVATQLGKIKSKERELLQWQKLHQLIGSADGAKYRTFVQGLTFAVMVGHANRQLKRMSERYLLTTKVESPLELLVIDSYQAGEVRSTKNLSGGESFMVSLALALGLSNMASQNVRVDSLFLDEGFGTLDEESLDTALETLSSLQQEGKVIGIISHVSALKERLGTQIQVIPHSGGRSQLKGPGCRNISASY